MKCKVKKSFAGIVNGAAGKTIDIHDDAVASDLLAAGYIAPVERKTKEKAADKNDD